MKPTVRSGSYAIAAVVFAGAGAFSAPRGDATPPALVLNEVLFDAAGASNALHCYAFVELVAKSSTTTSGVTLRRADGSLIYALPAISLPAGAHVVVYIGPKAPSVENTNSQAGPIVLTSGHSASDVLGVNAGTVVLVSGSTELDRVSWGSAPLAGPFVDISFQGGRALLEGDSIGRSAASAYTGTSADWTIAGGVNANGATPGALNQVELPELGDVVLFQDTLLNSVLLSISQSHENAGWLQIVDTKPVAAGLTQVGAHQVVGQVHHALDVTIHGAPVALVGDVATSVTRNTTPGSVAEIWATSGSISSADGLWGLTLSFEQTFTGAHSLQQLASSSATYEWTHQGVDYVASMSGAAAQTRVDDDSFSSWDLRIGVDWSGAPLKAGYVTWTSDRIADGVWSTTSSVSRTYPSLPAYPGVMHASTAPIENVFESSVSSHGGRGLLSATTLAYAQFVNGALVAQLLDGEAGTLDVSEFYDASGHYFSLVAQYPLGTAGGAEHTVKLGSSGVTVSGAGKEVTYGSATATLNGLETHRSSFVIDPPQGNPVPLPTPPFRPHGEVERKIIERIGVWVSCVEARPKAPPKQPKPTPLTGARFVRHIPVLGLVMNLYCAYRALRPLF